MATRGRVFEPEIVEQLDVLPEFIAEFGFLYGKGGGYEADDWIASAATAEETRGGTALVASGDRDSFQLASDRVTILQLLQLPPRSRRPPDADQDDPTES